MQTDTNHAIVYEGTQHASLAALTVTHSGRWVATCADDFGFTISIRDTSEGRVIREWPSDMTDSLGSYPFLISFSPDGSKLILGGHQSGNIDIWDPFGGVRLTTLSNGHSKRATCGCWLLDKAHLATVDDGGQVCLWDMEAYRLLSIFPKPASLETLQTQVKPEECLAISSDYSHILSRARTSVSVWGVASGVLRTTIIGQGWNSNGTQVLSAVFNSEGTTVVTLSSDALVCRWMINTGELLDATKLVDESGSACSGVGAESTLSPDGSRVCWTTKDGVKGMAHLSETKGGSLIWSQVHHHRLEIRGVVFSPDGDYVATTSRSLPMLLWRVRDGKQMVKNTDPTKAPAINTFSSGGELLVMGGWDGTVTTFQISKVVEEE